MRAVLLCLLMGGCTGAHYAHEARAWAVGRPLEQVEGCVGMPTAQMSLPSGDQMVQWNAADPSVQLGSLPLALIGQVPGIALPGAALAGTLPLTAGGGSCRAIATVRHGVLQGLHYAGPGDGLSGPDAVCGVDLMRGCMREQP
jgi:hypothetical protein